MSRRGPLLLRSALRGVVAGVLGVAAMTAGEKLEQSLTRRPGSYVPGRALLTLVGRHAPDRAEPLVANHLLHWATGATPGAVRGVWSVVGLRGPRANLAHTVVRLSFDQTVENATGAGAPPHTWPVKEQVVDVWHKAVFSLVTGVPADRWIPDDLESHRGTTSH